MTFHAGDSGHIKAHNDLRAAVLTEAARFGVAAPNLAGPFVGGEPNHIGAHNALVTAIRSIATAGGIDLDGTLATVGAVMPDTAHLGDSGHPRDHDDLTVALGLIQFSPAWNSATGGTVTEYTKGNGEKWRVHSFTANDTFTLSTAIHPFRVLLVGGGGGVGVWGSSWDRAGGGGGGVVDTTTTIAAGSHPVTVGAGGALWDVEYGGNSGGKPLDGGATTAFGLTAGGGQCGQASPHGIGNGRSGSPQNNPPGGGHGSGGNWANNGGGAGSNGAAGGAGLASDITGASVTYAQGGAGGSSPHGGRASAPAVPGSGNGGNGPSLYQSPVNNPGSSGVVIVSYRIG